MTTTNGKVISTTKMWTQVLQHATFANMRTQVAQDKNENTRLGIGACFWPSLGGCVCERFLGTGCGPKGEKQNQTTSTLDKVFLGTKVLTKRFTKRKRTKSVFSFSKVLAQECRKTFPTTGFYTKQKRTRKGTRRRRTEVTKVLARRGRTRRITKPISCYQKVWRDKCDAKNVLHCLFPFVVPKKVFMGGKTFLF